MKHLLSVYKSFVTYLTMLFDNNNNNNNNNKTKRKTKTEYPVVASFKKTRHLRAKITLSNDLYNNTKNSYNTFLHESFSRWYTIVLLIILLIYFSLWPFTAFIAIAYYSKATQCRAGLHFEKNLIHYTFTDGDISYRTYLLIERHICVIKSFF